MFKLKKSKSPTFVHIAGYASSGKSFLSLRIKKARNNIKVLPLDDIFDIFIRDNVIEGRYGMKEFKKMHIKFMAYINIFLNELEKTPDFYILEGSPFVMTPSAKTPVSYPIIDRAKKRYFLDVKPDILYFRIFNRLVRTLCNNAEFRQHLYDMSADGHLHLSRKFSKEYVVKEFEVARKYHKKHNYDIKKEDKIFNEIIEYYDKLS